MMGNCGMVETLGMWRLGAMADEGRGFETKEMSFGGCVLA
jgi:hypothetical protein